jgi:hypothetical protein
MLNNILMIIITVAFLWVGNILYWSFQEDSCITDCGEWDKNTHTCRPYECRASR